MFTNRIKQQILVLTSDFPNGKLWNDRFFDDSERITIIFFVNN